MAEDGLRLTAEEEGEHISGKEPPPRHRLLLAALADAIEHGDRTTKKFGRDHQLNKALGEMGELISALAEGSDFDRMDEAADVVITVLQIGTILAKRHDGFAYVLSRKVRKMRTKYLGDEL